MQIQCGTVAIINDTVADEPDEQFIVQLTDASPVGNFAEGFTCITIIDDDRKFCMTSVFLFKLMI